MYTNKIKNKVSNASFVILLQITVHFKFLHYFLQIFIFVFKWYYYLLQQQNEEKGRLYLRHLIEYSVATEYNSNHCQNILQISDKLPLLHVLLEVSIHPFLNYFLTSDAMLCVTSQSQLYSVNQENKVPVMQKKM